MHLLCLPCWFLISEYFGKIVKTFLCTLIILFTRAMLNFIFSVWITLILYANVVIKLCLTGSMIYLFSDLKRTDASGQIQFSLFWMSLMLIRFFYRMFRRRIAYLIKGLVLVMEKFGGWRFIIHLGLYFLFILN